METEYGPDLEGEIVHGWTAAVVDDALKDNMVRDVSQGALVPAPERGSCSRHSLAAGTSST